MYCLSAPIYLTNYDENTLENIHVISLKNLVTLFLKTCYT